MNQSFKLSIITPTFNSEKTIERTLSSVIQQKSADVEYIIIDGRSQDSTLAIVEKYAKDIDVLISEDDQGAYDAMNKGVQIATGDIIGIINSDDWYNFGAFDVVREKFTESPDLSVLYSPIHNYFDDIYVAMFQPGSLSRLPIRFTLNHPSCFIKKSAYEQVGLYNVKYKIAADYDLILRLFMAGLEFQYVELPLASYSLNGMSSSTNLLDRFQLIQECWMVGSQFEDILGQELKNERRRAYINWVMNEIFALPVRHFFKPPLARKLKTFLRQYFRQSISDEYGQW